MHFDSADGNGELSGNLFILHAATDQCDDFVFARGKSWKVAAVEKSDDLIGDRILDPDVTVAHCAKTVDDGCHRQCLLEDPANTVLESTKGLDFGDAGDPKNSVAVKGAHPNLRNKLESRLTAGRLIEQNDVRLNGRDGF